MSDIMDDPERDAAILATLPHVPAFGWTLRAVRAGLADTGGLPDDAEMLFPGGPGELVAAYIALVDRWMAEDAAAADMTGLGTTRRVRAVIALRLARLRPHRDAVRLAAGTLALPTMARWSIPATRATVDAIWHAAGEKLEDASRHTKRPILAMVYASTLLFWLRSAGEDDTATLAFLDRRLADVGRIGKLRARLGNIPWRKTSSP